MATQIINKAVGRTFKFFNKGNESIWDGPFAFIQAADTQFGMIESIIEKKENPKWHKEIKLTMKAITAVNKITPRPRFFVVCGDLVDAFPGNPLRPLQEQDFFKVFSQLLPDIPLICVCGNHDLGNVPTQASVQDYVSKFGDDYFSFNCGGVMFIVINSQFYEDCSLTEELAESQDVWLDKQLNEAKSGKYKHVIVFQHIPWFLKTPNEEKVYFNIENKLRQKMLQKLYNGGVRAIFCGHYHRNAGGFFKDMEVVVTSAIGAQLGTDTHGFRIVKVMDDSIQHQYYSLDEIPTEIKL